MACFVEFIVSESARHPRISSVERRSSAAAAEIQFSPEANSFPYWRSATVKLGRRNSTFRLQRLDGRAEFATLPERRRAEARQNWFQRACGRGLSRRSSGRRGQGNDGSSRPARIAQLKEFHLPQAFRSERIIRAREWARLLRARATLS